MRRVGLMLLAAAVALPLCAQTPPTQAAPKIYAQELVDKMVAKYPELLVLVMHVTPPKSSENVIIASNVGMIGKKADPDDLDVIKTGKPLQEVNKTGDRFEVQLPLQDANKRTVGGLEMAFPYKAGDDKSKLFKKAETIRDELRKRISHVGNLVEPAQFDPNVPLNTYAQYLVDDTLAKHPEVVILAVHVNPPKATGTDYPIIASNIGRIGKKADEDDLHVIQTGEPKLEVNKEGDRFESELVLQDVSGDNIGALGVVFPYKKGDNQAALHKKAEKIRAELQRRITNAGNLYEPYPYAPGIPTNTYAQKLVDKTMAKHPDLLILAMHVSPPNGANYPIIASNIGRIGKKADEDDMKVIETGKPLLEINAATGRRFEVELQLQDKSGKTIGALSVVYPYKKGDDESVFLKKAEKVRDEIQQQIPTLEKLVEPA